MQRPWGISISHANLVPVTFGTVRLLRDVVEVIFGVGMVRTTPALVPIHNRSLHTSSDVMRRHAALCCRIMSSAAENITVNVFMLLKLIFISKIHFN